MTIKDLVQKVHDKKPQYPGFAIHAVIEAFTDVVFETPANELFKVFESEMKIRRDKMRKNKKVFRPREK